MDKTKSEAGIWNYEGSSWLCCAINWDWWSYKSISPLFSTISKGILIFDKFKAAGSFAEGFKTAFPVLSKIIGVFGKVGNLVVKNVYGNRKKWTRIAGLAIKSAFLANPVGVVIIAIVAVIAILVVLYNKCAGFRKFC